MTPERWRRALTVFQSALTDDTVALASRLDELSADDPAIREALAELLRAHTSAGDFLESPAVLTIPIDAPSTPADPFARSAAAPFTGTDRYQIRQRLGEGGMGVVYEALDTTRQQIVALKTLRDAHPADLLHFKREFRSLADVAHPNLVPLYELVVEEGHGFFTMERIHGVDLLAYLDDPAHAADRIERLRDAFGQLADGIDALHRHGKLHRDIKPSNVLIAADRRVVILDFGLVADVTPEHGAAADRVAGTPAYLAPEDLAGGRPSEASDWYAVGVTLYRALTGHLPFAGSFAQQLEHKRTTLPEAPAGAFSVPFDLSETCMDLLSIDPARRLSARNGLLTTNRHARLRRTPSTPVADADARTPFVGRNEPLRLLDRAFAVSRRRAAAVAVHGPSGIGKSALIREFLDRIAKTPDLVILRGRCYEHETVPYKALDMIVDRLSQHLAGLPPEGARTLLPPGIQALARLFPVLFDVAAIPEAVPDAGMDPIALRRQAFAALRALLAAIAEHRPLVFVVDDLHWADADSALLLDELLRPPQAPTLLTILSFRSEETAAKPFLRRFLDRATSDTWSTLALGPIDAGDAERLMNAWLAGAPISAAARRRLEVEAAGNPFFIEQLASHVARRRSAADEPASLIGMIDAQLDALPEAARPLIETLAVCGRPMPADLVHQASGLHGDDRPLVSLLRSAHLLRSSGSSTHVEVYHDRIRQALTADLSSERTVQIHGDVIRALLASGIDDPDALFEHYRGAGNRPDAAIQGARAAVKAHRSLAFDRAAERYRAALDLDPGAAAAQAWKQGLATALADAGRPADAAEMYLNAASGTNHPGRIEWERRAAEQFLVGGHIDRGLQVIQSVLSAVGLRLPPGPRSALVSLLLRRAQLRLRGLDFRERPAAAVPDETLLRIDTCWSVTTGLALVDAVRASHFQTRHLLLALDAGEPFRVARALAIETLLRATNPSASDPPIAERARALADRVANPHVVALASLTAGVGALLAGEWRKATGLCERAIELLSIRTAGATWELTIAQNFFLGSLLFRGELKDVAERMPPLLADAKARGNLYFETELRTRMNLVWLAADRPDEGEREANEAMARWAQTGFQRQHYNHTLARMQTALYRGDGTEAWRLIDTNWAAMKRTFLFRIKFLRIETSYLRARAALLQAEAGLDVARFLAVAGRDADRIEREGTPWANPIAWMLRAAIAAFRGKQDLARQELVRAIGGFERADMQLYAAAGRSRLATLVGGDEGRALSETSMAWMTSQAVANPDRLTAMLAPGFVQPRT